MYGALAGLQVGAGCIRLSPFQGFRNDLQSAVNTGGGTADADEDKLMNWLCPVADNVSFVEFSLCFKE